MQKQVVYPKIMARCMGGVIDLFILAVIFSVVMGFFTNKAIEWQYGDYFQNLGLDVNNSHDFNQVLLTPEFQSYAYAHGFITFFLVKTLCELVVVATLYVICWTKLKGTPGMYLMNFRLVDETTYKDITLRQAIIRALAMIPLSFTIAFARFSEKKQALYDKLSGTILLRR